MDTWVEFGRGPLFRLAFSLMLLGLLRAVLLTLQNIAEAWSRVADKSLNAKAIVTETLAWLLPAGRLWRKRPVYSTISFLFHIGLIVVPLFLLAHIQLWRAAVGFAWPAIPANAADWLTLLTVATGLALLGARIAGPRMRAISRTQDYLWPILLVLPFLSGYLLSHVPLSAAAYQRLMFVHVYSAALVMLLIPFTKVAHCVLLPFSQLTTALAWKFVPHAGDRVAATLGHAERPCWIQNARAAEAAPTPTPPEVVAK